MNELYEKHKYRKFSEIEEIQKDIILKSRVKNFINRYKNVVLIAIFIIMALIIVTFHSTPKTLLLVICMYILMLFSIIYFNTYSIICKNNKITIKMNMQEIQIEYCNLKNVYIENKKSRIFFKKRNNYSLIILYKAPNGNISTIQLPLMFINKNDLNRFLKNFIVKTKKSNNVIKAQKYQFKRLLIKMGLFIIIWLIIIITLII
ncbi:MAG: hypothetical protein HFJ41_04375 [Clostridia bacterium]|nr:hypothetical protein [Clostridia bacterium]